ncbi:2'-5' RNA ligase family protein [Streptomyces sp. SID3343]|uniref:2'-5' RNA ligase family protein n=1 Tax=Streptomyces sp. SID3343 TaxID=2690260 RepID=UPI00136ABB0F|nr:2'-5' RNA ligase family protein [Streptomyces sp. SID3343]MYV98079.1 2'-5' RNA ligase family protein [Streptomyces sp. SID3343]
MAKRTIGVSIAIPEPYGSELQARRAGFGDPLADAIPTHVTLLPPTEIADEVMAEVEEHLRAVAAAEHPFDIHLRGTGTFRPTSPVVFVQVARGIPECERVEEAVRSGPLARDLHFPYHPHVTIAHHLPDDVLDLAFAELVDYDAVFPIWGFSLYEHGSDGVWRPQRDFAFGQSLPGPPPG